MTLQVAIAGLVFGFLIFRESLKRRAESGSVKAIPYFLVSLFLTLIAMCALCGSLAQMAGSIFSVSR